MAQGEELLIAEGAERDREGLRTLFESDGYVCTVMSSAEQARDLVRRKFFPVALIDVDFSGTNEGLDLAAYVQHHSRPTKIVMLTSRRSFDAAVRALRVGAIDVVSKHPDQVNHLRSAMQLALDRYHSSSKDSLLLREARGVLDDAMRIMVALGRKLYNTEPNSGAGLMVKPAILIIDEDQVFLQQVGQCLADKPWEVSVELRGGSGLDRASSFSFQIVCVRDELADLPGHMLLRSSQSQRPGTLGLLYSQVGAGRVDRYEQGVLKSSDTPFRGPEHLVEALVGLVASLATIREERRYLQAFRNEYGQFFKRYADLKARIDSLGG
jgi:DNA-binding NtrC family response regulator